MGPFAPVAVLATPSLLVALPARAGECHAEVGPNDRVSRGNRSSLEGRQVTTKGPTGGRVAVTIRRP
jgi:hypothetical protein